MPQNKHVQDLIDWMVTCGALPDQKKVDISETEHLQEDAKKALMRGWRGVAGHAGCAEELVCLGGVGFFQDIQITRGGGVGFISGGYLLCFMIRPLDYSEAPVIGEFATKRFLLEALEDCGRAITLAPSRRNRACAVAVERAQWRERAAEKTQ
jgi:hypothetical protein